MKLLFVVLLMLLTGCAGSSYVCTDDDESEYCECERGDKPYRECHPIPDRSDRFK